MMKTVCQALAKHRNSDPRPASMHEALCRYRALSGALQSLGQSELDQDVLEEIDLLTGWIDLEGAARRVRVLVSLAIDALVEEDALPDSVYASLVASLDLLDQLAEAAFAVDHMKYHLHQHELAAARSGREGN